MKTIGIIGGMGPFSGSDLVNKITSNTITNLEQDNIPIILISYPNKIVDRSQFLLGLEPKNQ